MKNLKNISGGAREIEHPVGRWQTIEADAVVALPDSLAQSLAEQTDRWRIVPAAKPNQPEEG